MSTASALRRPASAMLAGLPALPWALSILVAMAGTLAVFPLPVLLGTAPFWDNPRGVVGGSWADMATAASGYDVYVRDAWRWPLFQAEGLGPHGVNIVFTDSVPAVALLGRLLFLATGHVVPLYGLWSGLCIAGMALAFTGLVRALGARSPAAAAAAAVIGVSMPALLARWGHLALMAQALVPMALIAYLRMRAAPRLRAGSVLGQSAALCLGSLLVHPYLFMMVGGIVAAAILQAGTDRRLPRSSAAGVLAGLAAMVACTMIAIGYGASGGAASDEGFGAYSANLLSLFLPYAGSAPFLTTFTVDGTGGQYEGMAFLGAGVLMLALLARRSVIPALAAGVRRHPWLLSAVAAFMALALSNEVYAGSLHLFSVPLPSWATWAAGLVRASGRFAWVGMYLLAALAIAASARRRDAALILVLAAGVQWIQVQPLRQAIQRSVSSQPPSVLDRAAWQAVLPAVDQVVVDPPFACMPDGPWRARRMMAAVDLQLLAAQAGARTNTLYAARTVPDCSMPPLSPRSVLVRLGSAPSDPLLKCVTRPIGSVCSAALGRAELEPLLPAGDAELPR